MKINLAKKSLRQALTIPPFILASSILLLSCSINSEPQISASTPSIPTLTASLTLSPLLFPTETPFPTPTQTPTFEPSALQLQAVLTAVVAQMGPCPRSAGTSGTPEVRIEHKPEGLSAYIDCATYNDAAFTVSIFPSDREAMLVNQLTKEEHNHSEKCFHGYVLYEETLINPRRHSARMLVQEWRTQRWVIIVRSFYVPGNFRYEAQDVSEALYTLGVEQGLFIAGTCP